jgi:hypothetical protein
MHPLLLKYQLLRHLLLRHRLLRHRLLRHPLLLRHLQLLLALPRHPLLPKLKSPHLNPPQLRLLKAKPLTSPLILQI